VLADFSARSNTPATLERALTISKPYVLLDANDTQNAITTDNRNVPGAADLFILSDVYFNRDRTLALTGIYSRCGGRCAVGEWKMFEKLPTGSWAEVLPDSNCKVMS
jgi:hypothetical protein